MTLGHPGELYFLAFDHRGSFAREVLGVDAALSGEQVDTVRDAKRIIFDGVLEAVRRGAVSADRAGVLVDEQFGGQVPRLALEHGISLAIAVERSSREVFEFEYGERFRDHLELVDPTFAKVLVRFNADGDAASNATQLERLLTLGEFLAGRETKFMYELLVPPLGAQLERSGGERKRYERELRPELIARGMAAAQEAGIEPDLWKIEGVETAADARAIVGQARSSAERRNVGCIVLGAGASDRRVGLWLDVAAATDGYGGFAIGRSIWRDPVRRYLDRGLDRARACAQIAARFAAFAERWRDSRQSGRAKSAGALNEPKSTRR